MKTLLSLVYDSVVAEQGCTLEKLVQQKDLKPLGKMLVLKLLTQLVNEGLLCLEDERYYLFDHNLANNPFEDFSLNDHASEIEDYSIHLPKDFELGFADANVYDVLAYSSKEDETAETMTIAFHKFELNSEYAYNGPHMMEAAVDNIIYTIHSEIANMSMPLKLATKFYAMMCFDGETSQVCFKYREFVHMINIHFENGIKPSLAVVKHINEVLLNSIEFSPYQAVYEENDFKIYDEESLNAQLEYFAIANEELQNSYAEIIKYMAKATKNNYSFSYMYMHLNDNLANLMQTYETNILDIYTNLKERLEDKELQYHDELVINALRFIASTVFEYRLELNEDYDETVLNYLLVNKIEDKTYVDVIYVPNNIEYLVDLLMSETVDKQYLESRNQYVKLISHAHKLRLKARRLIDYNLFCIKDDVLTKYYGHSLKVVIPQGVVDISDNAFEYRLEELTFPQTLENLEGLDLKNLSAKYKLIEGSYAHKYLDEHDIAYELIEENATLISFFGLNLRSIANLEFMVPDGYKTYGFDEFKDSYFVMMPSEKDASNYFESKVIIRMSDEAEKLDNRTKMALEMDELIPDYIYYKQAATKEKNDFKLVNLSILANDMLYNFDFIFALNPTVNAIDDTIKAFVDTLSII